VLATAIALAQDASPSFEDLAARAAAARNANDSKSAIALYRQALRINPDWVEGLWMAGSLQYDSGQYADAAEPLRHLAELRPPAGPAWALLGLCEYETGNYAPALDHIQRGLSLGVGDQQQMILVLSFHQAILLTKAGRFDDAIRAYAGFVPAKVDDDQVLLGLGLANLHETQTPAEVSPSRHAMVATAGRALAAFLAHDTATAQAAYQELIAHFPGDARVHYAYGYFLFGFDQDHAIEEWRRALAIAPDLADADAMLSWTYWLREEKEPALLHAKAAVAHDPNLPVAQVVLGRLLAQSGQIAEGIEHLERAIQTEPANLEAHMALATAYSEAGRKADSRRERQLCVKMQSEAGSVAQP
jgi:tetratricopeptide (TPR) repeat protein